MTSTTEFNADLLLALAESDAPDHLFTIQDFMRFAYSLFNRSDIYFGHSFDNSWDEAAELVLGALALPLDLPTELYQSRLTPPEKTQILEMLAARLGTRAPVAYLTQRAWFAGLEFYVDERVIVPRSPIGELIESRFEGILAHEPANILDLCTGSGCIAIACATQFPDAHVDAVDLSLDALAVSEINIARHQCEDRVYPMQSDLFSNLVGMPYDLIVTNPPYVDAEDLSDMPVEFHYEPELALGSGEDGLTLTRQILAQAAAHLTENGVLICEVGNSMLALEAQFPNVPFKWIEFKRGGLGVFYLTKADLLQHQAEFDAALTA